MKRSMIFTVILLVVASAANAMVLPYYKPWGIMMGLIAAGAAYYAIAYFEKKVQMYVLGLTLAITTLFDAELIQVMTWSIVAVLIGYGGYARLRDGYAYKAGAIIASTITVLLCATVFLLGRMPWAACLLIVPIFVAMHEWLAKIHFDREIPLPMHNSDWSQIAGCVMIVAQICILGSVGYWLWTGAAPLTYMMIGSGLLVLAIITQYLVYWRIIRHVPAGTIATLIGAILLATGAYEYAILAICIGLALIYIGLVGFVYQVMILTPNSYSPPHKG